MRPFLHAIAVLLLAALPSAADDLCRADVNSTELLIDSETLSAPPERPGLGERTAAWPWRRLDGILGRAPRCDSRTLIAFLSNEVPADQIDDYCLLPDERLGYLLVPGKRNYRGRCARTTCERINAAKDGALGIAGAATDILTGRDSAAGESRTTAILHSSGMAILSGTAASIASSLGTAATTLTATLSAPAVAGAATVSLITVGGAVFLCR